MASGRSISLGGRDKWKTRRLLSYDTAHSLSDVGTAMTPVVGAP